MCCAPVYPDASDEEIDEMVAIVGAALHVCLAGV
jgi:hypothetical protein